VTPFPAPILGGGIYKDAEPDTVTLSDIEDRLRSLGNGARDAVLASKRNTIAVGVIGGIATIAGAYLHGRRRGRRRATVLEVERR
jgi:hypothetical protein